MPKLTGQFGIMVGVKDLELSSAWYCNHLGFTLGPHNLDDFVELHVGGRNVLHLLKSDNFTPLSVPSFSLYVTDAETLHKELVEESIMVTDIIRRSDHIEFHVKDLDGNCIGLVEWI